MEHPRQITVIQAAIILISTIIGVGVLALSLFAVRAADSGAPLVTLLGFLVGLSGLWLLTKLGMRFPEQTIIEYSKVLIGKWTAGVFSVLIIAFLALLTALAAREFGEVVVTSVLMKTPLEVTVIVMLLLAAVSSRADITTFTYFHHFYFPVIVFPLILIVVLSLKNAHLVNLLPLWGNEPSGSGMSGGILTMAALFQGSFVMTIVIPAMRRPEKAMIAGYVGMGISGALYVLIVIATVGVFGAEEIKKLVWPTLELAKTTSLPANILERLDGAFLAVWVTAVFTTLLSTYYLAIYFCSQLLRLKDHKMFAFFLVPFIYVIAMFPQNLLQMYEIIQVVGRWGLIFTVVYPLVLFIIAVIRKKKSRGDQLVAKSD